ncbi:MAG: hypothetical protein A6F71_08920 [Cycloclasticus sp. symbiont of Poecilosclerida sp. M]|nr:MAG: hypothetical protein A6F71_08920 [Cycloclasticus sp. symbiont of Poecilosclerida sp. M]
MKVNYAVLLYILQMQTLSIVTVRMVTCVWWEAVTHWRAEWKSASTEHGALYVTMDSTTKMLQSFATNLIFHLRVSMNCDVKYMLELLPLIGATAFPGSVFGQGTGPIFMESLLCSGTEPNILDCSVILGYHFCSHVEEDASVQCLGTDKTSSYGIVIATCLLQMWTSVCWIMATAVTPVLMTFLTITVNVMMEMSWTQLGSLVFIMWSVLVMAPTSPVPVYLAMRTPPPTTATTALVS